MRGRHLSLLAAAMAVTLVAGACAGDGRDGGDGAAGPTTTTTTVVRECPIDPEACTLRGAGDAAGVLVGAAVAPGRLDDPAYARLVAEEFSSLTPENHMKWPLVHPEPDVWVFEPADRLVAFAEEHDLAVRGHTLVWGQAVGNGLPDWVAAIDDLDELQAVIDDHISTLVGRYAGRVDRWDVVNEPLESLGAALDANHFLEVLGPDYIASAFEAAHRADPRPACSSTSTRWRSSRPRPTRWSRSSKGWSPTACRSTVSGCRPTSSRASRPRPGSSRRS